MNTIAALIWWVKSVVGPPVGFKANKISPTDVKIVKIVNIKLYFLIYFLTLTIFPIKRIRSERINVIFKRYPLGDNVSITPLYIVPYGTASLLIVFAIYASHNGIFVEDNVSNSWIKKL